MLWETLFDPRRLVLSGGTVPQFSPHRSKKHSAAAGGRGLFSEISAKENEKELMFGDFYACGQDLPTS